MGEYRTIVADPPWDYGADHGRWPKSPSGGAVIHSAIPYEAMTLEQIRALPVGAEAASDARLFLWATSKHLPDALGVMTAWGFTYKQTLIWHKTGNPSPFGGSVAPNHAELLLVGVKGSPPVVKRLRSSVVSAKKPRAHSVKPECFQDAIEQVSPGPYLELFARRERLGWDTWGDQSANSAGLDLLPV
jgi:N6-adenosine-specific RNA methylase IME4